MLGAYIFTMFMSSWWILHLSIVKWPSGSLFMALLWKPTFSHINIATPAFFSCPFAWEFVSSPSLSVCISLLSWDWSLVGSICVGHVFLSIQLFYVFWLEHLIHLRLRLLSIIASYSLPLFCTCVPPSLSLFLPFLKAVPLTSLAELVWWLCILLDFFCLGRSLFDLLCWLRALLSKVALVAGLWFSLLAIFLAILFWLGVFPLEVSC